MGVQMECSADWTLSPLDGGWDLRFSCFHIAPRRKMPMALWIPIGQAHRKVRVAVAMQLVPETRIGNRSRRVAGDEKYRTTAGGYN